MLIRRRNSYAARSKPRAGRREAQSRGTGQQSKNPPCVAYLVIWQVVPTIDSNYVIVSEVQVMKHFVQK
jgi:hypothetical protein